MDGEGEGKSLLGLLREPSGLICIQFWPHFYEKSAEAFLLGLFAGVGNSVGNEKELTAIFAVSH